jgi:chloride channel 3/4/5
LSRDALDDLVIEVADLPYLDAKAEYIHAATPSEVLDADVPYITLDTPNTVASLRQQLIDLYQEGRASGFPIVGQEEHPGSTHSSRMYGYIASKELEHGLALARTRGLDDETIITFKIAQDLRSGRVTGGLGLSGILTPAVGHEAADGEEEGELDFSWLVDSAPIVVNIRSPMELLHEVSVSRLSRHTGLFKADSSSIARADVFETWSSLSRGRR